MINIKLLKLHEFHVYLSNSCKSSEFMPKLRLAEAWLLNKPSMSQFIVSTQSVVGLCCVVKSSVEEASGNPYVNAKFWSIFCCGSRCSDVQRFALHHHRTASNLLSLSRKACEIDASTCVTSKPLPPKHTHTRTSHDLPSPQATGRGWAQKGTRQRRRVRRSGFQTGPCADDRKYKVYVVQRWRAKPPPY